MKIWKMKLVQEEIGTLDGHFILPMIGRVQKKMKSVCSSCNKKITSEKFLGGIKKEMPNMLFHVECVEQNEKGNLLNKGN